MRKQNKDEKGITLVALIITIIILLILAGISISSLTGSGLFVRVQEAKQKTENAQVEENTILENYLEQMNKIVGRETLASKVKVGDYVTYTPDKVGESDEAYITLISEFETYSGNTDSTKNTVDTLKQETNLKWRVLDVVDGKVRLISEVPTTSKVALRGAKGYNNAVYLLDKVCRTLYNNSKFAEKVQNLKIEDIQNKMKVTDFSTINPKYGTTYSPTNKYYPSIFWQEKDQTITASDETTQPTSRLDLSEQNEPINKTTKEAKSWIIKYKYWTKTMLETDFTNQKYYELFMKDKDGNNYNTYWMSSRCVAADSDCVGFRVYCMDSGVFAYDIYSSYNNYDSRVYAFRPVITLNSDVIAKSGDGTPTSAYEIGI